MKQAAIGAHRSGRLEPYFVGPKFPEPVTRRAVYPSMRDAAPYTHTTTVREERFASSVGFPRWWAFSTWMGVVFCGWLLGQPDAKWSGRRAEHALLTAWVFSTPLFVSRALVGGMDLRVN